MQVFSSFHFSSVWDPEFMCGATHIQSGSSVFSLVLDRQSYSNSMPFNIYLGALCVPSSFYIRAGDIYITHIYDFE